MYVFVYMYYIHLLVYCKLISNLSCLAINLGMGLQSLRNLFYSLVAGTISAYSLVGSTGELIHVCLVMKSILSSNMLIAQYLPQNS